MEKLTTDWINLGDPSKIIDARDAHIKQIETDSDKIQQFLQDESFWKLYFREYFTAHTDKVFEKSPLKQENIFQKVCMLANEYYDFKVYNGQKQVTSLENRLKFAIQYQFEKVIDSLKDKITEPISMYNILAFAEQKKNIPALKILFKAYYPTLKDQPNTDAKNDLLLKCQILLDDLKSYPEIYLFLQDINRSGTFIYKYHKHAIIHGTVKSMPLIHSFIIPIPIYPEDQNFLKIAAEHGKLEHTKYLLTLFDGSSSRKCNTDSWYDDIFVALQTAIHHSELEIFDVFVDYLFKWEPENLLNRLFQVVIESRNLCCLKKLIIKMQSKRDVLDLSQPLTATITRKFIEESLLIIKENNNFETINGHGEHNISPLHTAIRFMQSSPEQLEIIQALLNNGADLSITCGKKYPSHNRNPSIPFCFEDVSPLHNAISYQQREAFFLLIKHSAHANINDQNNKAKVTPLHVAVLTGQIELIQALLISGANPTLPDALGRTPIQYATYSYLDNEAEIKQLFLNPAEKKPESVKMIQVEPKVEILENHSKSEEPSKLPMVSSDLFNYICNKLDDPNDIIIARYTFFHQVIHNNTSVQDFLKDTIYWTTYFQNKFTTLIDHQFSCEITCTLAQKYFNFDNPFSLIPKGRQYPLPIWQRMMAAIEKNHEKVIETFLPKLANEKEILNIPNFLLKTKKCAVLSRFFDYCFDSLKNLDLKIEDQWMLTQCVIIIDRFKEYKEFYAPIKDLVAFTQEGYPLLHCAAINGTISTIDEMIQMGTDPAQQSKDGLSLIHTATMHGKLEIVKYLIEKKSDINAKTNNMRLETSLHLAIRKGFKDIACLIIESGADLNIEDGDNQTPLLLAAGMKQLEIIKKLLEKGADISMPGELDITPLHLAIEKDFTKGALMFIEKGADINAQDSYGKTPLHYAVLNNRLEIAEKLLEKKADTAVEDNNQFTPQDYLNGMEEAKEMKELFRNHEFKESANIDDREAKKPRH